MNAGNDVVSALVDKFSELLDQRTESTPVPRQMALALEQPAPLALAFELVACWFAGGTAALRRYWPQPACEALVAHAERLSAPRADRLCHELIRLHMCRLGDTGRKNKGVYYTPADLGDALARAVIDRAAVRRANIDDTWLVVDPACGSGDLLLAAIGALEDAGMSTVSAGMAMRGIDIDPVAVGICRARVAARCGFSRAELLAHFVTCDALAQPLSDVFADDACEREILAVIANPPFGNAIEKGTARTDADRKRNAAAFPNAATGAYDRSGLFVELALEAICPDGVAGIIVPRALLAAPYATKLRSWARVHAPLSELLHTANSGHFNQADVYVAGLILDRAASAASPVVVRSWRDEGSGSGGNRGAEPTDRWSVLVSPYRELLNRIPPEWVRLDSLVTIRASATVAEAYDLREHLLDIADAEDTLRLITSGSIDPGRLLWGKQPTRYLKSRYTFPRVPLSALSARRREHQHQPKVLVAGLSAVLEAVADTVGDCNGAVATLTLECESQHIEQLEQLINTDVVRAQFLALYAAQALGGGSVQVTKKKLGEMRVPVDALQLRSPVRAATDIARFSKALPDPEACLDPDRDHGWLDQHLIEQLTTR